jgi:hypothetical protein
MPLIKHIMKMNEGVEVWFHTFLSSALDDSQWSASRPDRFNSLGMG